MGAIKPVISQIKLHGPMLDDCGCAVAFGISYWRDGVLVRKAWNFALPWQMPIPYRLKVWLRGRGLWAQ